MKRLHQENPNEEVADYMNTNILTTKPETSLQEAAQYMSEKGVGSLLVKDAEDYVGIVTETDMTRKAVSRGLNPQDALVKDVMSTPLITLDCHEALVEANQFMAKHHIRHLAVTDQKKVIGILSVRDLVHYYSNTRIRSW
ncbi:MAG: cyclic nucleotide-binding/CBS domain-containing protein [Nitrospinaceae bacterium]